MLIYQRGEPTESDILLEAIGEITIGTIQETQ